MNDATPLDPHGRLVEPATLEIQRILPGPIERVWAYLTDGALRRKWLAAGDMELRVGAPFTLTWRNDDLTDPPGTRPEGFSAEHSMQSRIVAVDPPRRLTFTWGEKGEVTFTLDPAGSRVRLTVLHRRVADHAMLLKVSAGWHMHLDVLVARVSGTSVGPFWDGWVRLHGEYAARLPE